MARPAPYPAISDVSDDLNLATCDHEPIQYPGSIQPHGVLLVVDPDSGRVLRAALGTLADALTLTDPVGRRIEDVLPTEAASALAGLNRCEEAAGVRHLGFVKSAGHAFHLVAHRSGSALILELEQAERGEAGSFEEVYPFVAEFLGTLHSTSGIEDLAALAAREVRRITGLDRALVYRFDENYNGTVIAEDRSEQLPSYLGLRFPASEYRRRPASFTASTGCA